MQEMGIVIENLSKAYGKKQALRGLNLNIAPGMFGLLGKNGAGKTPLMKTATKLLKVRIRLRFRRTEDFSAQNRFLK